MKLQMESEQLTDPLNQNKVEDSTVEITEESRILDKKTEEAS